MDKFLVLLGALMLLLGVKMIYDARPIVKMYFSFGDENEAVFGMKILGAVLSAIGSLLLYFLLGNL